MQPQCHVISRDTLNGFIRFCLCHVFSHSTPRVETGGLPVATMDEEFKALREVIKTSQREMEKKITDSVAEMKRDVAEVQRSASQEVVAHLNKSSYQFRKKGNEVQFQFNSTVEESMNAARKEIKKVQPATTEEKEAVKKATIHLDEGIRAIETRQKHIKVADRSEYGWVTVSVYEDDALADNSEDERRLEKAEREAERITKRRRGANAAKKRPREMEPAAGGPSNKRESNAPTRQAPPKPRVIGPCYRCAEWGHLAATCPKRNTYPFDSQCQLVVSQADTQDMLLGTSKVIGDESGKLEYKGKRSSTGVDSISVNEAKASEVTFDGDFNEDPQLVSSDHEAASSSNDPSVGDEGFQLENSKFWELEAPIQLLVVQGRLKQNQSFWKDTLNAPAPVIDYIDNGYRLSLKFSPPPFLQNNHRSAIDNKNFVSQAVNDLVSNRCVRSVSDRPYGCSPLSVVSSAAGKQRLVLNLRYLNKFLQKETFKYKDLRIPSMMFERHEYMFKFDLKSGYHHVDIYQEHQKYLGFRWDDDDKVQYFVFTVLPFGLSTACYCFTKLMRPLVRFWRGRGLKAILYLDDGVVAVKGKEEALRESKQVQQDLQNAGLVTNLEKSQWEPIRCIEWLGFIIDLEKGQFLVPPGKLASLHENLMRVNDLPCVPACMLASVIGKIVAMSLALGPVTRMMTRSMYGVLNAKQSWCQCLLLSPEAKQELNFWLDQLSNFNGSDIWPRPSAVRMVYSDASSTGYGGYMVEHGDKVATGQWSAEEANQSSTWRELHAVRLVLESFKGMLSNERIRWFTDNQNVVRIVLYGSRKPELEAEALSIFSLCA